jgi:hypothetical protein
MSEYETIKRLLRRTPFLVANPATGQVTLRTRTDALRIMADNGPFPSYAIIDLASGVKHFVATTDGGEIDREFGLNEIAACAGMTYHNFYRYVRRGVFAPSIRPFGGSGTGEVEGKFSWADAFAAGVVGSLQRLGLKPGLLSKVQPLLIHPKKQTGQPQ